MYYFGFSFGVWVWVGSYGSGTYSGAVDSFFVFVVVCVGPVSFVFSVGVFGTFGAAVFLSVMGFLEWFSTVAAFGFRVVNCDFHVLPR